MSAPDAGLSWSPAVIGLVGVVVGAVIGFVGNVLTGWIAHRETDRTRFHDVRRELYAKLLTASQECRTIASRNWVTLAQHDWTDVPPEKLQEVGSTNRQITGISNSIQLIGSKEVCRASERLGNFAIQLTVLGSIRQKYDELDATVREAERSFLYAARAELLPMGAGARLMRHLRRHRS